MTEDEKKLKVATFRFGIISEFVNGLRFSYGEREKFIKDKISRSYEIPYSAQKTISRTTIEKWIYDYKYAGNRIEGLYPRTRDDKGKSRALTSSLKLAITEFKKENPKIKLPALITTLRQKKLIGQDEYVHSSSVYRYIKAQELNTVNENAVDKRLFEAEHPNEIWQSDVMHGPYVKVDGKLKKSYLIAIIDDHSRFIVHAEFYLNETRENLLDTLRQAILKRGLPQIFYIDNGSCFKALQLEQVAAQLGIAIKHSRPYTPQGRGKIERWFKYVRDHFLSVNKLTVTSPDKLDLLNYNFSNWVDEYNNRVHGSTKQKPYDRYCAGLECVRPAPAHLINYFRQIEFRRVKKDRTVRIKGGIYEVPVSLIDRRVALRFHPEDLSNIEIYFNEKSYGMAVFVNPHINSKIGRNWDTDLDIKKEKKEYFAADAAVATGKLFESRSAANQEIENGEVVL